MPIPAHVLRFWRSLDELFANVRPMPWGAVVTDGRFPRIWDANYARIDEPVEDLTAAEVAAALLPALRAVGAVGADAFHVVTFHPEATTGLLAELSSRGDRLTWDLVMDLDPSTRPPAETAVAVREHPDDDHLWGAVGSSFALFGIEPEEAVAQLQTIERDVLAPGGKRWFGVDDERGRPMSLGALLVLDGVGYVDNVATEPQARGRGYATAVTARIVREARRAGAAHVWLLVDPDDKLVVRLYERLGFRRAGMLGSTRGPLPER